MRAIDFMTRDVAVCSEGRTIKDAAKIMELNDLSVLPIINENGELTGIITASDFIGKEVSVPHAMACIKTIFNQNFSSGNVEEIYKKARDQKLSEVMSKNVHTVGPEMSLSSVVEYMMDKKLKRLPVVKDRKLVGIITRKDIIKAFNALGRIQQKQLSQSISL